MSEEQKAQLALRRQRTRALVAEAEHDRTEARRLEWVANSTRLTREELDAGEPCRGCGLRITDGLGRWPPQSQLSADEQVAYDQAEASYQARHGACRTSRWTLSGSRSNPLQLLLPASSAERPTS